MRARSCQPCASGAYQPRSEDDETSSGRRSMTVEPVACGGATGEVIGTQTSRAADEIVARLERLPFTRFHLHMASVLGMGTFFDAFDGLSMGVALTVIFTTLH